MDERRCRVARTLSERAFSIGARAGDSRNKKRSIRCPHLLKFGILRRSREPSLARMRCVSNGVTLDA